MYFFLTELNKVQLPGATNGIPIPGSEHAFNTTQFLNKLRTSYDTYSDFITKEEFQRFVITFQPYADCLVDERGAEFFFCVRIYESKFHSGFEDERDMWWERTLEHLTPDSLFCRHFDLRKDFIVASSRRLGAYRNAMLSLAPPGWFQIEHTYDFLTTLQRRFYGEQLGPALRKAIASMQLTKTEVAKICFDVFQKNIPLGLIVKLLEVARNNPSIDSQFLLCRELFFDEIKHSFVRCAGLSFEKVWADVSDTDIQSLKGSFIDLLLNVFESPDLLGKRLQRTVELQREVYWWAHRRRTRIAYLRMVEGLRSGFPFGFLGEQTRKILTEQSVKNPPLNL